MRLRRDSDGYCLSYTASPVTVLKQPGARSRRLGGPAAVARVAGVAATRRPGARTRCDPQTRGTTPHLEKRKLAPDAQHEPARSDNRRIRHVAFVSTPHPIVRAQLALTARTPTNTDRGEIIASDCARVCRSTRRKSRAPTFQQREVACHAQLLARPEDDTAQHTRRATRAAPLHACPSSDATARQRLLLPLACLKTARHPTLIARLHHTHCLARLTVHLARRSCSASCAARVTRVRYHYPSPTGRLRPAHAGTACAWAAENRAASLSPLTTPATARTHPIYVTNV